jgi:glucosamine-6-phosphate deaminase
MAKPEICVVPSVPNLGVETAIDFLNWVSENPRGVISLPTGRTPEYFIKAVESILADYPSACRKYPKLKSPVKPVTSDLVFCQMDEFVPFRPTDRSFKKFIDRFYVPLLGLRSHNVHTIDFDAIVGEPILDVFPSGQIDYSARFSRTPWSSYDRRTRALALIDEFCDAYEEAIATAGGLGFILLGVGPDGHVAYNCFGTSPFSRTRLTPLNYPTKAAAAGDLGGVEPSLQMSAITIGLGTILDARKISAFAAGEAKSGVVSRSINVGDTPLGVVLRNASDRCCLFLTEGAAKQLKPAPIVS